MTNTNTATQDTTYNISAIIYDNVAGRDTSRRLRANAKAISSAALANKDLELQLTQVHRLDTPVCNDTTLLDEATKGGYEFYIIGCQASGSEDARYIVSEMLEKQGIPQSHLIILGENSSHDDGYSSVPVCSGNGYLEQQEAGLVVDKILEILKGE